MTLHSETKYPSGRSYVLNVSSHARPDALQGRLEHIVTGRTHVFASAQELLRSIATDLLYDESDKPAQT